MLPMKTLPEARICLRKLVNGQIEISVYDPHKGRESRTGLCVPPDGVDDKVRELKVTLERNGCWVTVKEMR